MHCLIVQIALASAILADGSARANSPISDHACAVRAVRHVLIAYGIHEDFDDLYEEMGTNPQTGTCVAAVVNALSSRGINTAAVETTPSHHLVWSEPAIMLIGAGKSKTVGHFVVVERSLKDEMYLWDGFGGLSEVSRKTLQQPDTQRIYILTSKTPIDVPQAAFVNQRNMVAESLIWPVLALCFAGLGHFTLKWRSRKPLPKGDL